MKKTILAISLAIVGCAQQQPPAEIGYAEFGQSRLYYELAGDGEPTVVLLHGLFASREVWKDVAVGIARDNGLAVALTPDLLGFGESPLADDAPENRVSPDRMAPNTSEWLELIGLGRSPTVMLGHSISASALLCTREDKLGPETNRICLTPALPASRGWSRVLSVMYT